MTNDVRVPQARRDLRLVREHRHELTVRGELTANRLDRDELPGHSALGAPPDVDRGHPPVGDLPTDLVATETPRRRCIGALDRIGWRQTGASSPGGTINWRTIRARMNSLRRRASAFSLLSRAPASPVRRSAAAPWPAAGVRAVATFLAFARALRRRAGVQGSRQGERGAGGRRRHCDGRSRGERRGRSGARPARGRQTARRPSRERGRPAARHGGRAQGARTNPTRRHRPQHRQVDVLRAHRPERHRDPERSRGGRHGRSKPHRPLPRARQGEERICHHDGPFPERRQQERARTRTGSPARRFEARTAPPGPSS